MTGSAPGAPGPSGPDPAGLGRSVLGLSDSERPGPSLAAVRARRLLAGGLAGAHVVALGCVGIFLVRDGAAGLASSGLAAAMVILFYTLGQAVQVRVADASAVTVFRASVASYVVRVTALGALLAIYLRFADDTTRLLSIPLAVTAIGTVVGWLTGEILVYSRLRILNFDEPSDGGPAR